MGWAPARLSENYALPWGEYAAWFSAWVGFVGLILAAVFLMLYRVCQADHRDNNVNGRKDELGEPCWIS